MMQQGSSLFGGNPQLSQQMQDMFPRMQEIVRVFS